LPDAKNASKRAASGEEKPEAGVGEVEGVVEADVEAARRWWARGWGVRRRQGVH
jgi:hypothetical protein